MCLLAKVNDIAKLIPEDLNITFDTALEKDADLQRAYDMRLTDATTHSRPRAESSKDRSATPVSMLLGSSSRGDPLTDFIPLCVCQRL